MLLVFSVMKECEYFCERQTNSSCTQCDIHKQYRAKEKLRKMCGFELSSCHNLICKISNAFFLIRAAIKWQDKVNRLTIDTACTSLHKDFIYIYCTDTKIMLYIYSEHSYPFIQVHSSFLQLFIFWLASPVGFFPVGFSSFLVFPRY